MTGPSFRGFLQSLDDAAALVSFSDDRSWDLEVSAITTLANRSDGEVPVFESVGETAIDASLVGDPYRGPRCRPWDHLAQAFGLSSGLSGAAYYEAVVDRLRSPREPRVVDRDAAPCKDVVDTGADVDLLSIPWPYLHQAMAGAIPTSTPSSRRTRRPSGDTGRTNG